MSAAALYTPEMLGLATSLAGFPLHDGLPLRGAARSAACGSTIDMGLALGPDGTVTAIGLRAQACAVGQAAAAIFAVGARGLTQGDIETTLAQLEAWLGGGRLPDWPGLGVIAAALDFPGRHGAILLPWRAALVAMTADR